MPTECSAPLFDFEPVERRQVVTSFDGGQVTSDGGALLLARTDRAIGLIDRFAGCFGDSRSAELVEHPLRVLVGQRVLGIALGYEDLVDHDQLRFHPVLAAKLRPSNIDAWAGALEEIIRIVGTMLSCRRHDLLPASLMVSLAAIADRLDQATIIVDGEFDPDARRRWGCAGEPGAGREGFPREVCAKQELRRATYLEARGCANAALH